jgi:hypothetical protein
MEKRCIDLVIMYINFGLHKIMLISCLSEEALFFNRKLCSVSAKSYIKVYRTMCCCTIHILLLSVIETQKVIAMTLRTSGSIRNYEILDGAFGI